MNTVYYDKEKNAIFYADNNEKINRLAILFDKNLGTFLKYGDYEQIQSYVNQMNEKMVAQKNPNLLEIVTNFQIATLDSLSKEDACMVVEYFYTHTNANYLLKFFNEQSTDVLDSIRRQTQTEKECMTEHDADELEREQ